MSESHHERDSALEPISGEAPDVAGPISVGRENGAIPRHDDWGDDLKKVVNESRSSEPTLRQIIHKIPTLAWCNLPDGSSEFPTSDGTIRGPMIFMNSITEPGQP
jgi:hypothetical protein